MRPPNTLSVVSLLIAGSLFLATRSVPHAITIDDTFLHPLAAQVQNNDTFDNASHLFYDHFDDLVYLTRRAHPQALIITQHVLAQGHTPGECGCCSGGFRDAVFADGLIPPGYLEGLAHFTLTDQIRLLAVAHSRLSESIDFDLWEQQLEQHIATQPALAAAWKDYRTQLAAAEIDTTDEPKSHSSPSEVGGESNSIFSPILIHSNAAP